MASLDTMPEELIDKAISFHGDAEDIQTLASLSLVSKKIHRIVAPHLYRRIITKSCSWDRECSQYAVEAALRTLLDQPDLARHVQAFRTIEGRFERKARSATAAVDTANWDDLTFDFPNLQTLDLDLSFCSFSARCALLPSLMNCSNLYTVKVGLPKEDLLCGLLCLFLLPSVAMIDISGASLDFSTPWDYWEDYESTVQHLILDIVIVERADGYQTRLGLRHLANACKTLKSISLRTYYDVKPDGPFDRFDYYSFDGTFDLMQAFRKQIEGGLLSHVELNALRNNFYFCVRAKNEVRIIEPCFPRRNKDYYRRISFEDSELRENHRLMRALLMAQVQSPVRVWNSGEAEAEEAAIEVRFLQQSLEFCARAVGYFPTPASASIILSNWHYLDMRSLITGCEAQGITVEFPDCSTPEI